MTADLPDLAPTTGPLVAVETILRAPVAPAAHLGAKIIHVMNGRARFATEDGERALSCGDVLILAGKSVSATTPDPWLRLWIVYVDEDFFRQHMRWAIPEHTPSSRA